MRLRGGSDFSEGETGGGIEMAASAFNVRPGRRPADSDDDSEDQADGNAPVDLGEIYPNLKGMGIKVTLPTGNLTDDVMQKAFSATVEKTNAHLRTLPHDEVMKMARHARDDGVFAESIEDEKEREAALDLVDEKWDTITDQASDALKQYTPNARKHLFGSGPAPAPRLVGEELAAIDVPRMTRDFPAACEKAMETGQAVHVAAGDYTWLLERLAVFPNSSLTVAGVAKKTLLRGQWEMAEGSSGRLSGLNITWEAGDEDDATLEVQGGDWTFVSCDLRCEKGCVMCVYNGWHGMLAGEDPMEMLTDEALEQDRMGDKVGDVPSRVLVEECALGGLDDRWERATHLDPNSGQAHSGVDVAGTSVVELVRCSILDTAATAGRAVDDSRMVLRLCHVAYGMSGLLAFDRASLEVEDSRVDFMFAGAAVRGDDSSIVRVDRCDIKECAIGVAFYNAASVSVSRTNFLNSSFAAFSQGGESNECKVALASNTVYCCGESKQWIGDARPASLQEEGTETVDPLVQVLTADEEAKWDQALEDAGVPDQEEWLERAEELVRSGELDRLDKQSESFLAEMEREDDPDVLDALAAEGALDAPD